MKQTKKLQQQTIAEKKCSIYWKTHKNRSVKEEKKSRIFEIPVKNWKSDKIWYIETHIESIWDENNWVNRKFTERISEQ